MATIDDRAACVEFVQTQLGMDASGADDERLAALVEKAERQVEEYVRKSPENAADYGFLGKNPRELFSDEELDAWEQREFERHMAREARRDGGDDGQGRRLGVREADAEHQRRRGG